MRVLVGLAKSAGANGQPVRRHQKSAIAPGLRLYAHVLAR
jgi:hypothetical protein